MADKKHRVAIIGCGRMGQGYADAYSAYPDTEIVAIAEYNPERRKAVGERYGVTALYPDVDALLKDVVPDIAAVVTPVKYFKEAVLACAEAGVKGVSTDKPIAARLSDADEMVAECERRGVVYAGGNLMRARHETHEVTQRLRDGKYGELKGAAVHRFMGEISGGCCQQISILRLLTGAEVDEVIAWGEPGEALDNESDVIALNGLFRMSNGLECQVFGMDVLQSSPNPKVGCHSLDRWLQSDAVFTSFNPHPTRRLGAMCSGIVCYIQGASFQSSPNPKVGCHQKPRQQYRSTSVFQSSPNPKVGCHQPTPFQSCDSHACF